MRLSLPYFSKWQRVVAVFFLLSAIGSVSALPAASSSLDPQAPDAPTSVYLPLTMQSYEPPPPPTSFELIDTALQQGQISSDAALEYKVFAVFDDSRLPAGYRAQEVGGEAGLFMNEVVAAYPTLSTAAKAVVEPFFIPPYQSGSWATQAKGTLAPMAPSDWAYVEAVGGQARVWYKKANAEMHRKAGVIANALTTTIWPLETALMGRTPVRDSAGVQNIVVYDHYRNGWQSSFVPMGRYPGMAVPQTCSESASILYINPIYPDNAPTRSRGLQVGLTDTTAHEFMHALQFSFPLAVNPCTEYAWMGEATAAWAEDFVYPDRDTEWRVAQRYLDTPEYGFMSRYNWRDYGEYMLVYWMTHNYSDDYVRMAWANAGAADSLHAFAAVGNLNFMQLAALWNKEPFDTFFNDSEGLNYQVKPAIDDTLKATGGFKEYDLWDSLKPGGARVFHFKVDSSVRTITFLNGLTSKIVKEGYSGSTEDFVYNQEEVTLDDVRGVDVVTMVKFEGSDEPYVLPNPGRWDICQDWLKQKATEIVVIIANNDVEDRDRDIKSTGKNSRIMVSSTPCMKLTGSATRIDTETGSEKQTLTATGLEYNFIIYDILGSMDPRYVNLLDPHIEMKLVKGTVNWQISGTDVLGCTHSGSQSFSLNSDNGPLLDLEFEYLPGSKHYMGYTGTAGVLNGEEVTDSYTCKDGTSGTHIYVPGDFFMQYGENPVKPDGSLSGSYTYDQGAGITTTYEWNFQPSTLP